VATSDANKALVSVPVTLTVAAPDITVSPSALAATLVQGATSTTRTLTLGNVGINNLTWSLAENPSRTWLSESLTSGTIAPAANRSIVVTFTATGLTAGVYTTTLSITSNDPDENPVNVPVTLTVTCAPVSGANFSFSPSAPRVGQTVRFTGTVTAGTSPITYTWNWGDGSAASVGSPINHSFPMTATTRTYTVTLTTSNGCSAPIVSKPVTVYPYKIFMPLVSKNH
jgi:PKD repeat protein